MTARLTAIVVVALAAQHASAKECWTLTELKGYIAPSTDRYAFQPDKFSRPMVLCFNDDETGSVSGDDTHFARIGASTLVGVVINKGIELVESYQLDRVNGKILFAKSRIGTATLIPGGPDLVSASVGNAVRLRE